MIKILLVDRNPYIRQGLQMYLSLQPDFIVVGETDNEQEAIKFARDLTPDVIVMDIQISTSEGLEVIRLLHESQPSCAVIILTLLGDQLNQEFAKKIGVAAFVSKKKTNGKLIDAIRKSAQVSK